MIKRRRKWTRARRARHAKTMAEKRDAGLPKTLPPVIFQYYRGKIHMLRLTDIQAYVPVPDDDGE